MNKESLINKLTLIDTSNYRRISFLNEGKYKKEPRGYRSDLKAVYSKLGTESLIKLLSLKSYKL